MRVGQEYRCVMATVEDYAAVHGMTVEAFVAFFGVEYDELEELLAGMALPDPGAAGSTGKLSPGCVVRVIPIE